MKNMVELGTLIRQAKTVRCEDSDYPVLSMTMRGGLVFQDEKFKKVIASKDKSNYKVVYRNQLVIGFPIDEGVLASQHITDAGIVSPAYGVWDIDQKRILPEFLEYSLRSKRAIDYYKAKLRGSTARRRSLPTPTLLAFTVSLPEIEEQREILNIIRNVKGIINAHQQELQKLDELIKARFVEMFGDLAAPDCKWTNLRLVDVCANSDDIKCGPFGTQLSKDEYVDEGIAVWEIPQINTAFETKPTHYLTTEKAKQLSAYSIVPGDIAMSGNVRFSQKIILMELFTLMSYGLE
jgi:type I restriction enzyme S subunit